MEKSFSHAKDVKLSKTQRSCKVKTEVNLCLLGNIYFFSTPYCDVNPIIDYPWKRILLSPFGNPLLPYRVSIFASRDLRWLNTNLYFASDLNKVCPQYLVFWELKTDSRWISFQILISAFISTYLLPWLYQLVFFDCKQPYLPLVNLSKKGIFGKIGEAPRIEKRRLKTQWWKEQTQTAHVSLQSMNFSNSCIRNKGFWFQEESI